jgi:2'-5' RNA ligase
MAAARDCWEWVEKGDHGGPFESLGRQSVKPRRWARRNRTPVSRHSDRELPFLTVNARRQLSMYVPKATGAQLASVRQKLDPVQAALIPAHVTLCREDEIDQLSADTIEARIRSSAVKPITLRFGRPTAFQGHGVLLPCVAGEDAFHALRAHVLGTAAIRTHAPHITLAHPRNLLPLKSGIADATGLPEVMTCTFDTIFSIEQIGAAPWRVLQEFTLTCW